MTGHDACFYIYTSLLYISFLGGLHACRSSGSSHEIHNNSIDWTLYSSTKMDRVTSDVVAPSSWTIFGCQNGNYKTNTCDFLDSSSCLSKTMSAMQVLDCLKKLKTGILMERLVAFDSSVHGFTCNCILIILLLPW